MSSNIILSLLLTGPVSASFIPVSAVAVVVVVVVIFVEPGVYKQE
jgi:hypothetical protein